MTQVVFLVFLKQTVDDIRPFLWPLIPLSWTSGDVCTEPSRIPSLVNNKFLSSPLVQQLLNSWPPAWQPRCFRSTYLNGYKHGWAQAWDSAVVP